MKRAVCSVAVLAAGLATSGAQALEPLANYDKFSTTPIDTSRWSSFERTRQIKGKALNHVQRDWGLTTSDSGGQSNNFVDNLANPSAVTQIKAKITVHDVAVTNCAANTGYNSSVLARVIGSFFNTGNPSSGSQTGDMLALVTVTRAANTTDAPGVLQVGGSAVVCQNSDCSLVSSVGSFTGLGTTTLGTPVTVRLEWDKLAKTFTAVREGGATAVVTYTQSDVAAPGNAFKQVSTRTNLASCTGAGNRTTGYIDASFDDVAVNKSAAP